MKAEKWKWIPFPLFGKAEKEKNGELISKTNSLSLVLILFYMKGN